MSPRPPLPEANELSLIVVDDYVHARWAALTARFDAVMRKKLTEEALADAWAHVEGMVGVYKRHGDPAAKRFTDEFTVTDTMLNFETGDLVARITFRDDQTIAGLFLLNPAAIAAAEKGAPDS